MTTASSPHSRVQILDIIRGIAVLGILAANIFYFAFPEILASGIPVTDPDGGAGYSVGLISEILFSGKMRGLFAMLFGVSSVLILDRITQKYSGLEGVQIYFRRLLWLMAFGTIHSFLLLFHGDILFHYAIVGNSTLHGSGNLTLQDGSLH